MDPLGIQASTLGSGSRIKASRGRITEDLMATHYANGSVIVAEILHHSTTYLLLHGAKVPPSTVSLRAHLQKWQQCLKSLNKLWGHVVHTFKKL